MFEIMAIGIKIYAFQAYHKKAPFKFNIVRGRKKGIQKKFRVMLPSYIQYAYLALTGLRPIARQYHALLSRISLQVAGNFAMSDKSDPIGMSKSPCRGFRIAIPLL